MEVVKFEEEVYLASIIKNYESAGSCSYDREVAFYDYKKLLKLDGKSVSEKKLGKLKVFSKRIQGTKLPYEELAEYAPVTLREVKSYKVEVAKKSETPIWEFK